MKVELLKGSTLHMFDALDTPGGHVFVCLFLIVLGAVFEKLGLPYGKEIIIFATGVMSRSMYGNTNAAADGVKAFLKSQTIKAVMVVMLLFTIPLSAQTVAVGVVDGELSVDTSAITKKLYWKVPLLKAKLNLCNYTGAAATIHPEQVQIATYKIPQMDSNDALALINNSLLHKPTSLVSTLLTWIVTGIAIATGTGGIVNITAATLGKIVGAEAITTHAIIPAIQGLNPPMPVPPLSATLDGGGPMTLQNNDCTSRVVFVPNTKTLADTSVHFQFVLDTPVPMAPQLSSPPPRGVRPVTNPTPGPIRRTKMEVDSYRKDLDPEYVASHPTEKDPYYVSQYPVGYWQGGEYPAAPAQRVYSEPTSITYVAINKGRK